MNVSDFSYLLQKPEEITQQHVDSLKKILDEFPYFQAARAVYLKALKTQQSFKYNGELKKTAAYTTDRSILFEYITSDIFTQQTIAEKITQQTTNEHLNNIEVSTEEVIVKDNKTAFDFNNIDASAVMDPELFQPKETPKKKRVTETEKLQLGKPLEFNKSETHSFTEWMQLSVATTPIKRNETKKSSEERSSEEKKSGIEEKLKLIDKFLESNPKISPVSDNPNKVNLAKENNVERGELMTETLARVYLEQKKYKKAIQAYKILSLKYPEKSGFFADQIKAIKKLKDNN